jgi:hypothetical protein
MVCHYKIRYTSLSSILLFILSSPFPPPSLHSFPPYSLSPLLRCHSSSLSPFPLPSPLILNYSRNQGRMSVGAISAAMARFVYQMKLQYVSFFLFFPQCQFFKFSTIFVVVILYFSFPFLFFFFFIFIYAVRESSVSTTSKMH